MFLFHQKDEHQKTWKEKLSGFFSLLRLRIKVSGPERQNGIFTIAPKYYQRAKSESPKMMIAPNRNKD